MDIKEIFEKELPREFSGDHVFRKYRFQLFFGASLLLKLAESNVNSAVLMDYFDDVVVLDDCKNPTKISFYQVKTKEKMVFTMTEIISKDFLKKMSWNNKVFKECDVRSIFVSNGTVVFDFDKKKGKFKIDNFEPFVFNDCSPVSFETLISKIERKEEVEKLLLNYIDDGCSLSDFYLMKTTFSLDDFEDSLLGSLVNFLEKKTLVADIIAIKAINNAIIEALSKRQGPPPLFDKTSFEEILENKSLSVAQLNEIVAKIQSTSIPSNFEDIYNFSTSKLNYSFSGNILKDSQRYSAFKNAFIESSSVVNEVYCFLKTTDYLDVETGNVFNFLHSLLISNAKLSKFRMVNEYSDFIVVIFIYKMFRGISQ